MEKLAEALRELNAAGATILTVTVSLSGWHVRTRGSSENTFIPLEEA